MRTLLFGMVGMVALGDPLVTIDKTENAVPFNPLVITNELADDYTIWMSNKGVKFARFGDSSTIEVSQQLSTNWTEVYRTYKENYNNVVGATYTVYEVGRISTNEVVEYVNAKGKSVAIATIELGAEEWPSQKRKVEKPIGVYLMGNVFETVSGKTNWNFMTNP
jgi:hypothetical protein